MMKIFPCRMSEPLWDDLVLAVTKYMESHPGERYTVSDEIRRRLWNGKGSKKIK
jgi:hypothetical protein